MELLHKDTFSNIYKLSDTYSQTILIEWIGFWEADEMLKNTLDKSLDWIAKTHSLILISDCRKLDVMSEEVTNFLQEYWYVRADKLGLELEIYIDSEDLIGQISLEMLFEEVNKKDTIQTIQLENIEKAKEFALYYMKKYK